MSGPGAVAGGGRLIIGARALLFERLASGTSLNSSPVHDESALRASVLRELQDLLNTRVPVGVDRLQPGLRTTVDYGIPDLSCFPPRDRDAIAHLVHHIRQAIVAFEPRLHDPTVEVIVADAPQDGLTAVVRGDLLLGITRAPVRFMLPISPGQVDSHSVADVV